MSDSEHTGRRPVVRSEELMLDRALSDAMASPAPSLSADFDRKLAQRMQPGRLDARSRIILAIYAIAALALSIWALRPLPVRWALLTAAVAISAGFFWFVKQSCFSKQRR